jgi:hypothetical protein
MGDAETLAAGPYDISAAAEIEGAAMVQQVASLALDNWRTYEAALGILRDYRELHARGETPPPEEWVRELHEIGEARELLAQNALVALRGQLTEAMKDAAAWAAEASRLVAAMRDVQAAIAEGKAAQELWGLISDLDSAAELLGSAVNVADLSFLNAVYGWHVSNSTSAFVDEMIGRLAAYNVDLVLSSHGVASVQELQHRIGGVTGYIHAVGEHTHTIHYLVPIAEQLAAWPAFRG